MRRYLWALVAVLIPFSANAMAGKEQVFGQGVTGDDRVKIADLVASPEAYVGQTVRVEGVISKLTEKGGAWVELTDAGAVLRVDVNARKMSFPDDAMGKRVAVQGVFAKRVIPGEAGRADVAQAAVHGKSDLPTGEHGKSEYAHAAEHGKSAAAHAEKEPKEEGEKAVQAEKGAKHDKGEKVAKADKGAKHEKHAKVEKGEKVAKAEKGADDAGVEAAVEPKPAKADKVDRTAEHPAPPARPETVVYELEGTGAILL